MRQSPRFKNSFVPDFPISSPSHESSHRSSFPVWWPLHLLGGQGQLGLHRLQTSRRGPDLGNPPTNVRWVFLYVELYVQLLLLFLLLKLQYLVNSSQRWASESLLWSLAAQLKFFCHLKSSIRALTPEKSLSEAHNIPPHSQYCGMQTTSTPNYELNRPAFFTWLHEWLFRPYEFILSMLGFIQLRPLHPKKLFGLPILCSGERLTFLMGLYCNTSTKILRYAFFCSEKVTN